MSRLNASTAACTCGPSPDDDHLVPLVVGRRSELRLDVERAACAARPSASAPGRTADRAGRAAAPAAGGGSDHQLVHLAREQLEAGHARAGGDKGRARARSSLAGDRRHRAAQRVQQSLARRLDAHLAAAQESIERIARHQPAIEQRRQRLSQARLAQLGEQQRHVGIVERDPAADRQRAIERGFDESRRFGFVGEIETGIDAGLERKLVQQRQAERVDGADADVAERIADLAPARRSVMPPSRCRWRSVAMTR